MKNKDLVLVMKLKDQATAQFSKFKGTVQGGATSLGGTFSGLGGIIAGAFSVVAIKRFIDASNESEKASQRLNVALRNAGETNAVASRSLQLYAAELQKKTVYEDDAIVNAQALLVSMTGTTNGIKPLTAATLDLASALDMDVESAAQLVAKTIEGQNALGRYGIQVGKARTESERIGKVIEAISGKFGGFAEGAAKTTAGRMEQLSNAWGNFEEILGDTVKTLVADLLPALEAVLPILTKSFTSAIEGLKAAFAALYVGILYPLALIEKGLNELGISSSKTMQGLLAAGVDEVKKAGDKIRETWSGAQEETEAATQAVQEYGTTVVQEAEKVREIQALEQHGLKVMNELLRENKKQVEARILGLKSVERVVVEVGDVSARVLAGIQSDIMEQLSYFQTFVGIMAAGFRDMFTEALETGRLTFKSLLRTVLLGLIDMVQGMIIAAIAASAAKAVLFLGLTIPTDAASILAASAGLQLLRAFVSRMHEGGAMVVNGPPDRELPILVRGGETVRVTTPEQEREAGRSLVINFNAPVESSRWVVGAIKQALRETGTTVDRLLVNDRHVVKIGI